MKQKTTGILLVTFLVGILLSQTACKTCKCPAYSYHPKEQPEPLSPLPIDQRSLKAKKNKLTQIEKQTGSPLETASINS
ncbi:hypothetical protein DET65_2590 [Sunxiuqinia elliptica]|uniref:Lipoprotein n=1 Tax=Sunxiuqinia elliptica TaxID=655355 RepID=A0A4R6H5Q5_9BACT|nr:hypothetical protein DET52_10347 [Sunxiuqinia elliptica]TDO59307.1 hypothetical protein DET65_2590 [Sunxiuqinia elliptica]